MPSAQAVNLMNQLGQPVWRPGSPAGYDDRVATWAAPDALLRRVEVAQRIAAQPATASMHCSRRGAARRPQRGHRRRIARRKRKHGARTAACLAGIPEGWRI
jgi:uncharacterized protein (DUF1800 family)